VRLPFLARVTRRLAATGRQGRLTPTAVKW
jgi:hypothetical protein